MPRNSPLPHSLSSLRVPPSSPFLRVDSRLSAEAEGEGLLAVTVVAPVRVRRPAGVRRIVAFRYAQNGPQQQRDHEAGREAADVREVGDATVRRKRALVQAGEAADELEHEPEADHDHRRETRERDEKAEPDE